MITFRVSATWKYAGTHVRGAQRTVVSRVRFSCLPLLFCFWLLCMHKVRRNNVFLVSCRGVTYKDWVNLWTNLTSFLFSLDTQSEQLFWWRYDSQKKNSGSVGRQQAKKIAKGLRVPSSASHGKTTFSIYKSHSILKPKGKLL